MTIRTLLTLLPLALLLIQPAWSGEVPTGALKQALKRLAPHPRLLVAPGDFDRLKQEMPRDPFLQAKYREIKKDADSLLKKPPRDYEIPDGKRLLSVSRSIMDRVYTLALVYRLEKDSRYLDRCWTELEHAAAFKDWNPSHFLDTAEMTHAFAIGYDWLFDAWTPLQRETLRLAMVRHGLEPGFKCYQGKERYGWWVKAVHNWNQVCNGGLTLGALALADEEPGLAKAILQGALASIPRALHEYAPTGGYREGPGYWAYGTTYNVYMLAGLQTALGTDFGLAKAKGFNLTGYFPLHMTGTTGTTFNFADGSAKRWHDGTALIWLGRRFRDPVLLEAGNRWAEKPLDLIWYRKVDVNTMNPVIPLGFFFPEAQVCSLRASWHDPEATYVAFKGGRPNDNHAQMDLGSFVLDALGERWVDDLGADNYNLPGYFDRNNRRWHFYRNRAEGHNTLVLNPDKGPDQAIKAYSKITGFSAKPGKLFAIADLTPAYAGHASSVQRGIRLSGGKNVLIQDEFSSDGAEVYWFLHSSAKIALSQDRRTATLSKRGKTCRITLMEPAFASFTTLPAEALPSSPTVAGQKINKGVTKLVLHLPEATLQRIAVWITPGADKVPAPALVGLSDWR